MKRTNMLKELTRNWKGCCTKAVLFVCACLLLNWYQAHCTPAPLVGEEAPEQEAH